jgi:CBS domain-containing protein
MAGEVMGLEAFVTPHDFNLEDALSWGRVRVLARGGARCYTRARRSPAQCCHADFRRRRFAMNLRASDVMVKDVLTVTERMSLKEVTRIFAERKIRGAPVVDDKGNLLGVISETDIMRKTTSIGAWSPSVVGQIMTRPAVTVPPDEPLRRVCELMHNRDIHRVVVAEGGRIAGIITTMDILKAVASGQT